MCICKTNAAEVSLVSWRFTIQASQKHYLYLGVCLCKDLLVIAYICVFLMHIQHMYVQRN